MDRSELKTKIRNQIIKAVSRSLNRRLVPAAVSNRHAHLTKQDIERLFGEGYELQVLKPLSQPGQFAAKETLTLTGPKGSISGVRILGPARPDTQVEISVTDSFKLGIRPVVRMSGKLDGTPGGKLTGPKGTVDIPSGIIISARHIHMSAEEAAEYGLKNGDVVALKSFGERSVIFENVLVRSGKGHEFEVHLDVDEANAALIKNGDVMEIVNSLGTDFGLN